jgi:hypothetical protein
MLTASMKSSMATSSSPHSTSASSVSREYFTDLFSGHAAEVFPPEHARQRLQAPPSGSPGRPARHLTCQGTGFPSAHVRVAVVGRGHEEFLDRAGAHPPDQVEYRAGFVVGAAGPGAPERLLADYRAGRLVVDVEVARRVPQRLGGLGDGAWLSVGSYAASG